MRDCGRAGEQAASRRAHSTGTTGAPPRSRRARTASRADVVVAAYTRPQRVRRCPGPAPPAPRAAAPAARLRHLRGHRRAPGPRAAELQRVHERPRGAVERHRHARGARPPSGGGAAPRPRQRALAGPHSGSPRGRATQQAQQRRRHEQHDGAPTAQPPRPPRARDARLRRSPRVTATPSWTPVLHLGAAADTSWTLRPGADPARPVLGALYVPRWRRVRRDDGAAAAPIWRLLVLPARASCCCSSRCLADRPPRRAGSS